MCVSGIAVAESFDRVVTNFCFGAPATAVTLMRRETRLESVEETETKTQESFWEKANRQ